MTRLFSQTPMLVDLNGGALTDRRLRVINRDGFRWVRDATGRYDAIVVDLPDPVDFSIGKLYTETFYRELARLLAPGGVAVIQATSPLVAPVAFWTVGTTLEAAGLTIRPYHAYVPSFGEWGFILAAHEPIAAEAPVPAGRFLTTATASRLFDFPPDMARRPAPVNRLDNQALVRTFAEEWARYES